jgi:hypothetical protein
VGDAQVVPADVLQGDGEAVTGDRGRDDVEGVGGIAAVGLGIGERADDLEELGDRAGPAVGEDQRERVRLG